MLELTHTIVVKLLVTYFYMTLRIVLINKFIRYTDAKSFFHLVLFSSNVCHYTYNEESILKTCV